MPKVSVGSQNPVKIDAVQEAFSKIWPEKQWVTKGVDVPSGVADQPVTDDESIKGAITRAKRAMSKSPADFSVGLEGGLQKIGQNWYESGWAAVLNKKQTLATGSSIKMLVSNDIIAMIKEGKELGEVTDIIFKKQNSKKEMGYFGLMTKGAYTRKDAYRDGVISSLVRFLHPKMFED